MLPNLDPNSINMAAFNERAKEIQAINKIILINQLLNSDRFLAAVAKGNLSVLTAAENVIRVYRESGAVDELYQPIGAEQ
jgi:hypothetical protein